MGGGPGGAGAGAGAMEALVRRAGAAGRAQGLHLQAGAAEALAEAALAEAAAAEAGGGRGGGAAWLGAAAAGLRRALGGAAGGVVSEADVRAWLGPAGGAGGSEGASRGGSDRRGRGLAGAAGGTDAGAAPAAAPAEMVQALVAARNALLPQRLRTLRARAERIFRRGSGKGSVVGALGGAKGAGAREAGPKFAEASLTRVAKLLDGEGQTGLVIGLLTQPEDGRFSLEDESGGIRLDLSRAVSGPGFFCEGAIVLAQGAVGRDGVLRVAALFHPPRDEQALVNRLEIGPDGAPKDAAAAGPRLAGFDVVVDPDLPVTEADRAVVLSDLHLDRPGESAALLEVLARLDESSPAPGLVVLCGDFLGAPQKGEGQVAWVERSRALFAEFAAMLHGLPNLSAHAHFVLVPGPGDPTPFPGLLPRAALPAAAADAFRAFPGLRYSLAPNPCRVWWKGRCLQVLREDLQARLHQLSAVRPGFALSQRSAASEPVLQAGNKFGQSGSVEFDLEDVARKAVWATGWTLLSQGHTCPISEFEQPVMHHLDRMLQLEHVPDALVLCDRAAPAQVEVLGCLCLGPGAFSSRRSFAEISLADMRATIWEERPRAAERLALEHRGREFHLRPADAPSLLVK